MLDNSELIPSIVVLISPAVHHSRPEISDIQFLDRLPQYCAGYITRDAVHNRTQGALRSEPLALARVQVLVIFPRTCSRCIRLRAQTTQ
jgi:hypothetical protein